MVADSRMEAVQYQYNETLSTEDQLDTEELISVVIFGQDTRGSMSEEDCRKLGRRILLMLLTRFRPDMIVVGRASQTRESKSEHDPPRRKDI
jgi:hypothetical protein